MWELKSWFDESKLSSFYLSYNPNAVDYLSKYKYFIDWQALSQNENAIHLLLQNPDKIDWHNLSLNPSASYVLAKNMSYINWSNISKNPGSIDLLLNFDKAPYRNKYNFNQNPHPKAIQYFLDNPDEIVWESISNNENAIKIFEKYGYSKVDWFALSKNPRAIDILLSNTQYIYWPLFSINPHPKAVEYLKCNPHLIDWTFLSMNPSAEELILENLDNINWDTLCRNPIIFEFNMYKCATVKRTQIYKEELLATVFHPDRIKKYLDAGYTLYDIM